MRFLVCSPRLLRRIVIAIVCVEWRICCPVCCFLFDACRDQVAPGAWLDLRERTRQLWVQVVGRKITMVSPVALDDAPAGLDRLECWRLLRCTQNVVPSGCGSWGEPTCGRGSTCVPECVQCGLAHIRRPGQSSPGQPGTALCWTTRRRGDSVFPQARVVRGIGQDEKAACGDRREPWLGTPRGDMLPGHWPVSISCPFRSIPDHRGPWPDGVWPHGPSASRYQGNGPEWCCCTKVSSRDTAGRCRRPLGGRVALV